jgi:hypothetical protein
MARTISPPGEALPIEQIDANIMKIREDIRLQIEAFLQQPNPPAWIPPPTVDPNHHEFLRNLCIPTYEDGSPSLLFHELAYADKSKVKEIFGDGRHR